MLYLNAKRTAKKAMQRLLGKPAPGSSREAAGATFADIVDDRRTWLFENLPHESAEYLHDLHPKDKQKQLARRLGLSVADDYLTRAPLTEALDFVSRSQHRTLVLKPMHGRSATGVFCLVREEGGFRDLKSGKVLGLGALRRRALDSYGRLGRRDEWQVEELLLPADGSIGFIEDHKFYCFAGRTELILQKGVIEEDGHNRGVIRWYDRDWQPVETGVWPKHISERLVPPPAAQALVETAERATGQLPMPFMRIDLYDSHKGVVLGEFTPGPGGMWQFNAEWQDRLIDRWHEAAAKVKQRLDSGALAPMFPPERSSVSDR